jgi:hypothetical protein
MALLRAMERGTMLSIKSLRDDSPMAWSMSASSAGVMPMWRAWNSLAFSNEARVGAVFLDMAMLKVPLYWRRLKQI